MAATQRRDDVVDPRRVRRALTFEEVAALVQAAARHGLVILSCGIYGNVIRFLAPLTISDALLNEGLEKLEAALAEVSAAHAAPAAATAPAQRIAS